MLPWEPEDVLPKRGTDTTDINEDGELREFTLDELRPDPRNPRFPPSRQDSFADDEEIYRYIDREYDSYHIADSIQLHGYFPAEPMIAMPSEDGDGWTVLEGNRRLAALKGLADPSRRADYPDKRWRRIQGSPKLPEKYTVFVVSKRETVAPLLGFRHITGIAPWEPYAQARYVAQLVDEEGRPLASIPELIGRNRTEVNSYYRNYWIAERARDLDISDVARVTEEFGVWTRAMGNPSLRKYIGAPDPKDVDPEYWPVPDDRADELTNLITWIFGGPRNEDGESSKQPAINDSREITRLGRAIEDPKGLKALERGADLESAESAMKLAEALFVERLEEARNALNAAVASRPEETLEPRAFVLIEECLAFLDQLRERYAAGSPS